VGGIAPRQDGGAKVGRSEAAAPSQGGCDSTDNNTNLRYEAQLEAANKTARGLEADLGQVIMTVLSRATRLLTSMERPSRCRVG